MHGFDSPSLAAERRGAGKSGSKILVCDAISVDFHGRTSRFVDLFRLTDRNASFLRLDDGGSGFQESEKVGSGCAAGEKETTCGFSTAAFFRPKVACFSDP
jgi:hypothetical protein